LNVEHVLDLEYTDSLRSAHLVYREGEEVGVYDLGKIEHKLEGGWVKLVSMGLTSNLTGYTIPAKEIVKLAHEHGAHILFDGAQTVPHKSVDVRDLDAFRVRLDVIQLSPP